MHGTTLDRDACPLAVLDAYLTDLERWNDATRRRNAARRRHLDALVEACGGDVNVPYAEARKRLQNTIAKP